MLLETDDSGDDLPDGHDELLEIYFQGPGAKKRLKAPAGVKGNTPRDESKSTCKDCGKKGHWAGDGECKQVRSGQLLRFADRAARPKFGSARRPKGAAIAPAIGDAGSDDQQTRMFAIVPKEIERRRRELLDREKAVTSQVLSPLSKNEP